MMHRRSPPRHRHDGTSPLPMGMDWSPPPRKWNGKDTVWPHNPQTGWSYCVTIPSWVVLPKSRNSDPIVFYRVQVGVQSPDGVTTIRGVLRRFNDFLKLLTDLKNKFSWKSLPTAPPKGILRMKSRAMLEERRCSLEEWMTKLLSDIDLSRSVIIASFLELEAAARSAFQDQDQNSDSNADRNSYSSPPRQKQNLSLFQAVGSPSLTSDYGSDTAYEASEIGTTSLGRDGMSENGIDDLALDEDLTNPIEKLVKYSMSNIDEGLSMSQSILEQLEDFPKDDKVNSGLISHNMGKNAYSLNASKPLFLASNGSGLFSAPELSNRVGHARELSVESTGSQGISPQGSGFLSSGILKSASENYIDLEGESEVLSGGIAGNLELRGNAQIVLPLDMRNKLNRILLTMHQRIANAKTDMEDLVARLNQEISVKDYLNTKVNDLVVELETTKRKNKENLEQTIMIERERFTQMQWDMEELKRKSMEMELKLKSEQDNGKSHMGSTEQMTVHESDGLLKELDATKRRLEDLSRRYEELEMKSKGDIRVLVKEVKSLRRSQADLKQELTKAHTEKSEAEKVLQQEKQLIERETAAREKLVRDCRTLNDRLKEFNDNFSIDEEGNPTEDPEALSDALHLSDDQIKEAKLKGDSANTAENELRKILTDMFIENARFRKQFSSSALRPPKSNTNSNAINIDEEEEDELKKRKGTTE